MKNLNLLLLAPLFLLIVSCQKVPEEFTITANPSSAAVGDEVNFTISDPVNYQWIYWDIYNDDGTNADVMVVEGGGEYDLTYKVKFNNAGTYTIEVFAENSKSKGTLNQAWSERLEFVVAP